jgi:hypothetical protein
MATPYVTGPAFIFVGCGASYTPIFLGTAERSPRISIRDEYGEVFNDILGVKIPYDWSWQGEHAFITATINRFNEATVAAMQARPNGPTGVRGYSVPGDVGTLMIGEGKTLPLWVTFPYYAKATYSSAGMPPGYHFFATLLESPDDLDNLNTEGRKDTFIWHAVRLPFFSYGSISGMGAYLYDANVSGLPPVN